MSYFNNDFAGMDPDYPYFEDENVFESDEPIAGPSRSQDWYLNPAAEGDQSRYQGSTLLDVSGYEYTDPHATYPDAYGRLESCESLFHCSSLPVLTIFLDQGVDDWYTYEETVNIPAVGVYPSVGELAATHFLPPLASPTLAAFTGPIPAPPAFPPADTRKCHDTFD